MYPHPSFGASVLPSVAGMKCQMPFRVISPRFALTGPMLVFSQFRATPAGSFASAAGVLVAVCARTPFPGNQEQRHNIMRVTQTKGASGPFRQARAFFMLFRE